MISTKNAVPAIISIHSSKTHLSNFEGISRRLVDHLTTLCIQLDDTRLESEVFSSCKLEVLVLIVCQLLKKLCSENYFTKDVTLSCKSHYRQMTQLLS